MSKPAGNIDWEILTGFIDEASDDLFKATEALLSVSKGESPDTIIPEIFRVYHSIKGNAAYFGLFPIKELSHIIEQVLDRIRQQELSWNDTIAELLMEGTGRLIDLFEKVRKDGPEAIKPEEIEDLIPQLQNVRSGQKSNTQAPPPSSPPPSSKSQDSSGSPSLKEADKTMRVKESAIDQFLSYVGELVIIEEMYTNLLFQTEKKEFSRDDLKQSLHRTTEIFRTLSSQLQQSIMSIRKIPLDGLFRRMPKIVHDVATATQKKANIFLENSELLVDKTLIEKLEAPLVHMIRNAADHGIEPPEKRIEAGKPETGSIHLIARQEGEFVEIEIKDDGAGIDLSKIQAKAIELGILANNEPLTQQKIIDLMFHSGVSTAEKVTDISGRGVGMDVVQKNLQDAGGSIRVQTETGKGSCFTLSIPQSVTTQIIQGFIVQTQDIRAIFPLATVDSNIRLGDTTLTTIPGKGQMVTLGKKLVPIQSLNPLIHDEPSEIADHCEDSIVVVLKTKIGLRAVLVDAVDGIRQVVLKPVSLGEKVDHYLAGGAIMGDNSVALVIDVDQMFGEEEA